MGQLIQALKAEQIVSAKNSPKGTQLKLLLTLDGNQKVIFKPKWYERNAVIDGPVYSGKDRFNAEIFGFYLGSLLNMRWTPAVVGRKLNMKEIYDKADKSLQRTMTVNGERIFAISFDSIKFVFGLNSLNTKTVLCKMMFVCSLS